MTAVGGSVESISWGGRTFSIASDAEVDISLGGSTNEVMSNGDETARLLKTTNTWKVEGLDVSIDIDNGDFHYLQEGANSKEFKVFQMTLPSGLGVYEGRGQITGDIKYNVKNAVMSINFSGPGKLTKQ